MAGSSVPPPILMSNRTEEMVVIEKSLSPYGVGSVKKVRDLNQCVEAVIADADAVLILDWAVGPQAVNQVLEAIKGHFKVETRPVLVVAPEIDDQLISTCTDYAVSQVHAGPLSPESLKECLDAIFREDSNTREIRECLVQVATARSKGDWAIATPVLMELYEKNKTNERVALELAENLIEEEGWDHARTILEPFALVESPNVRALHLLGRCHMRKGDFAEAEELLKKAKAFNPFNVDRMIELGHTLLHLDRPDEAIDEFNAALAIDSSSKKAAEGKGQALLVQGEVNEALVLIKAVSGPRELASIFNAAAILCMHQNRFDQGMELYNSAMKALGRNDKIAARLMFNMGLGYKRWEKPERALLCFEKSLELDSSYVRAAQHKDALLKQHGAEIAKHAANQSKSFAEEEFTNIRPAAGARKPDLSGIAGAIDDSKQDDHEPGEE